MNKAMLVSRGRPPLLPKFVHDVFKFVATEHGNSSASEDEFRREHFGSLDEDYVSDCSYLVSLYEAEGQDQGGAVNEYSPSDLNGFRAEPVDVIPRRETCFRVENARVYSCDIKTGDLVGASTKVKVREALSQYDCIRQKLIKSGCVLKEGKSQIILYRGADLCDVIYLVAIVPLWQSKTERVICGIEASLNFEMFPSIDQFILCADGRSDFDDQRIRSVAKNVAVMGSETEVIFIAWKLPEVKSETCNKSVEVKDGAGSTVEDELILDLDADALAASRLARAFFGYRPSRRNGPQ